ncbi:hypothetical protein WMF37_26095 [Sorangium sp. So ce291]|uniref:hypothetical protein n=1 Tax=Sorangium sp. So ce291 TaxID=3133294 RepID=UPI003F6454DB
MGFIRQGHLYYRNLARLHLGSDPARPQWVAVRASSAHPLRAANRRASGRARRKRDASPAAG